MSSLIVYDTPLAGLKVIERKKNGDNRGFLSRFFCAEELSAAGWKKPIVQVNQVFTKKKSTVRGMHFQYAPYAEMKLVTCLKGAVCDVAVDLRESSPTFLQWHMEELSLENQRSLLIPEGFAHGYQTFVDDCELLYLHTESYMPDAEGGVNPKDPMLSIRWPLTIRELSDRDAQHMMLDDEFKGVTP